jgi:ABC-type polysaccharide/polyol phosphate export permease
MKLPRTADRRAERLQMAIDERSALARADAAALPSLPLAQAGDKPEVVIVGGPGRLTFASLRELWHFREVLWAFTVRQVKVRYKQAAVGVGWAVLQPVIAAAIFALFLGRYARITSENVPYLLFALAGMVAWTFFSNAVLNGSQALVANESMLRKLYFPREILPLSAVLASLVDLLPGIGVLALAVVLYGLSPDVTWLAVPIPALLLLVFASAVSVALSAVNVYYRDVKYALPFMVQIGLFLSPVVYPLTSIPAQWREIYTVLNPVAAAIDGLRRTMLHGQWPDWGTTAAALAWSLLLLLLGSVMFKRLERGFADRV